MQMPTKCLSALAHSREAQCLAFFVICQAAEFVSCSFECNNSTGHNDWLVWLAIWTLLHQATTARASCPRPELEGLLRKIDSICLNLSHAASIKSRVLLRSVDVHVCPWMSVEVAVCTLTPDHGFYSYSPPSPTTPTYTVRCVNEKLTCQLPPPLVLHTPCNVSLLSQSGIHWMYLVCCFNICDSK